MAIIRRRKLKKLMIFNFGTTKSFIKNVKINVIINIIEDKLG